MASTPSDAVSIASLSSSTTSAASGRRPSRRSYRLHKNPWTEKILWSCVARNDTILVEAGEDPFGGAVSQTARAIFQKKATPGWEYFSLPTKKHKNKKKNNTKHVRGPGSLYSGQGSVHPDDDDSATSSDKEYDDDDESEDLDDESTVDDNASHASQWSFRHRRRHAAAAGSQTTARSSTTVQPRLKAVKFHVFEAAAPATTGGDNDGENAVVVQNENDPPPMTVWVFCAVYNPDATTWHSQSSASILRDVQSFVQKLVGLTELPRQSHDTWRTGSLLACQSHFSATLLQRMQEVTYWGKGARVIAGDHPTNQDDDKDDYSVAQSVDARALMKANIAILLNHQQTQNNNDNHNDMTMTDMDEIRSKSRRLVQSVTKLQQKSWRMVRRKILMQQAKHGAVKGTIISAATALMIVPPLLVLL